MITDSSAVPAPSRNVCDFQPSAHKRPGSFASPSPAKKAKHDASVLTLPAELLGLIGRQLSPADLWRFAHTTKRLKDVLLTPWVMRPVLTDAGYALRPLPRLVSGASGQVSSRTHAGWRALHYAERYALKREQQVDRHVNALWRGARLLDGTGLNAACRLDYFGTAVVAMLRNAADRRVSWLTLKAVQPRWVNLSTDGESVLDWCGDPTGERIALLSQAAGSTRVRLFGIKEAHEPKLDELFDNLALKKITFVRGSDALVGEPQLPSTTFVSFVWPRASGRPPYQQGALDVLDYARLPTDVLLQGDAHIGLAFGTSRFHLVDVVRGTTFVHKPSNYFYDGIEHTFSRDGKSVLEWHYDKLGFVLSLSDAARNTWMCKPYRLVGCVPVRILGSLCGTVLYGRQLPFGIALGLADLTGAPLSPEAYMGRNFLDKYAVKLERDYRATISSRREHAPLGHQVGHIDFVSQRPELVWPSGIRHPARNYHAVLFDGRRRPRHFLREIIGPRGLPTTLLYPVAASETLSLGRHTFGLQHDEARLRVIASARGHEAMVTMSDLAWDDGQLSQTPGQRTLCYQVSLGNT